MLISSLNHRSASQQSHSARTKCHLTWCNFMESCLVILYSVWLRGEVLWTSRKLQSQLSVKHLARPYNWEVGKSFKEACTLGWLWFSHVAIRKKANPFPKNIWTCTLRGALWYQWCLADFVQAPGRSQFCSTWIKNQHVTWQTWHRLLKKKLLFKSPVLLALGNRCLCAEMMSRLAHRSCHLPWMSKIWWMRAQSEVKTFELKNSVNP